MGGGGSKTVHGAQVMGLSDDYGRLKKKILLETGKFIPNGMDIVIKATAHNIVDIKSMYNKPYLRAMGYAPNDGMSINRVSEDKVLEYTKNSINSSATYAGNVTVGSLSIADQVLIALQDKPNFKKSEMSFTHTDGKKYIYHTAVQNGSYIDIVCYLNNIETVTSYLVSKYPDGYRLLDMKAQLSESDGILYWITTVEYTYYEDEKIEEILIVNGKPTVVEKVIKVKKTAIANDSVPCEVIYISVQDIEEAQMNAIAQQYSGPFTTTGIYVREWSGEESGSESYTVTVHGTFTVTYIGDGEFSYDVHAPNPYTTGGFTNLNKRTAWDNGVRSYQSEKMVQISQATEGSIRRVIWDYGVVKGDYDGVKRAYASGNIINSFIVKEIADTYPIIPLKQGFQLVNSKNMDLVLKKVGIEGKDFHDSIRQKEIYDAYLFFGLPYSHSNPGLVEYIFELFNTLANVREKALTTAHLLFGTSSIHLSYGGMGMLQNYNVDFWVEVEPATRPVGTYWHQTINETIIVGYEQETVYDEDGWSHEITKPITETIKYNEYCHQESEDYYIRIRPLSIDYQYILGGKIWGKKKGGLFKKIKTSKDDKIELRLPIIKQITNKMRFNLLCDVIEQSISLALYTQVTVKKKWYQSGFFKFVMIVIIVVVAYFTGGAALSLLGPVMGVVVAGAIYLSAIMTIITMVTGTSFGVFGTVVGIIAAVGGGYVSLLNTGMTLTQTVMFTASQVLSLVGQVNDLLFSMKMSSRQKDNDKILNAQEAEKEKLKKEYDELYENDGMVVNMFNNFKSLDDIDNYYNMAVGNFDSYYLMLDYGTDYSKFYKV